MISLLAMEAEAVLAVYVMYCLSSFGVTTQLSETYYLLGKKGWVFQAVLVYVALHVFPVWVDRSNPDFQWLTFLTAVSLITVAVCPDYKGSQRIPHVIGACLSVLCTASWMALNGYLLNVIVAASAFTVITLLKKQFWVYWGELITLYTLLSSLT